VDSIDLKQIRCFVAAYQEGSFSKAAEREHCTQPGLSLQMRHLEQALAQPLFHRTPQGVTPTVAGHQFYAACTDILEAFKSAKQRMLDLAGQVIGSIRIGLPPALFKGALSWMLPEYMAAHPFVNVRLVEGIAGGTFPERVMSGDLEAAVVTHIPDHLGIRATHFFSDQLVLVTNPKRTTATGRRRRATDRVVAGDLADLKLVLPSDVHTLRQIIDKVVRLGDAGCAQILEIDGVIGKLDLVKNTDWATILPSIAVADEVKQKVFHADKICDPELWLDYYLICPAHAVVSVACRDFLDRLKEELERNRQSQAPRLGPPALQREPRRPQRSGGMS
jgi:LysR family nitrogen assimilation transcriptional regulator